MKNVLLFVLVFFAFAKADISSAQESHSTEQITMYWDASLSMQDRNIEAELQYLDSFFEKHKNAQIHFVSFSSQIILEETFSIKEGEWSALKRELLTTIYDGAVSFENVDFQRKTDRYILSTDGQTISKTLPETANAPVHILTNNTERSIKFLALTTNGSFTNTDKIAITVPKQQVITGNIKDYTDQNTIPLEGAVVQIVGTDTYTKANKDGDFSIEAAPENVLEISYVGKPARRVRVGSQKKIDITYTSEGDVLDEVILTGNGQDNLRDEEKEVDLGLHKIQKKRLGYAVQSITDEEISQIDLDVRQAVKGQFAGVEIANNSVVSRVDLSQFLGRHKNMSILGDQTGLVVIDGVPQAKSNSGTENDTSFVSTLTSNPDIGITSHINPDNIKSITYLKGLAATNRFGTLGKGGVILITTKTGQGGEASQKNGTALGTTATYSDNALELESLPKTDYIEALQGTTSIDDAFQEYLKQRTVYGNIPAFYLDVATYFKGWNNKEITSRILSNVSEIARDDIASLRAMAFKMEEIGDVKNASIAYTYIKNQRPSDAQSYRDLAMAYQANGDIKKAFEIYQAIVEGKKVMPVNASGIKESLLKEYKSLIAKHRSAIDISKVSPQFLKGPEKLAKRIIVEWDDVNASFDLQIVNPQNRFFTWEHTPKGNMQRIFEEKRDGFQMEEFFLTESDKGTWTFNLIYHGKTTKDNGSPVYVKFTVYDNYGNSEETQKIKVVRLSEINQPYTVLKLSL